MADTDSVRAGARGEGDSAGAAAQHQRHQLHVGQRPVFHYLCEHSAHQ